LPARTALKGGVLDPTANKIDIDYNFTHKNPVFEAGVNINVAVPMIAVFPMILSG
jgi:hypothetical protein